MPCVSWIVDQLDLKLHTSLVPLCLSLALLYLVVKFLLNFMSKESEAKSKDTVKFRK